MLASFVSSATLLNVFDPTECSQCSTPLLKCWVSLDSETSANVIEEQVFFCVTCRRDTSTNNGTLCDFYEKCKGSLTILTNPFEENSSWTHYIREKIIPCYKDFIQQTTISGLNKMFNTAKTILSVYDGEDLVQINHLIVSARKVLMFLSLGELFCKRTVETSNTRICELEQAITDNYQATRSEMDQMKPKIQDLMTDLNIAKDKLAHVEEKMKLSQADHVVKTDALEQALKLLRQNENSIVLKIQYEDAKKAANVSEARLTIARTVYRDEKACFDNKSKEINVSLLSLQTKLKELETAAAESESDHRKAIEKLKSSVNQATSKLELVHKAFALTKDHAMARADTVFSSSFVMAKEREDLEALCECVKYLAQEYIPDSIQVDNALINSDDLSEMKIMQRQVSSSPCSLCCLPILCVDGNVASCLFCPQEMPHKPVCDETTNDSKVEETVIIKTTQKDELTIVVQGTDAGAINKEEELSTGVHEVDAGITNASNGLILTAVPDGGADSSVETSQADFSDEVNAAPVGPETMVNALNKETEPRNFLNENIIHSYKDIVQQTTLSGLNKTFNTAKTILTMYDGEDLVQTSQLFASVRKVLIFLSLGEFFGQRIIETSNTRISELEHAIADDSRAILSVRERMQPKLQQLLNDLSTAKEKLAPSEEKKNIFEAYHVLNQEALEEAIKSLRQNENNANLKKKYEDAAKAANVSEARLTIAQHLYRDEKACFDSKLKEINVTLLPLQTKLKELETATAESESHRRKAIENLKSSVTQATSKLELVQKAIVRVKDHAMAWTDAVFSSPLVMAKETEVFEALCECVKYLVQEFIPDSSQVDDAFIFTDDLAKMKLMQRQVSASPCSICCLPILCVEDCNIATCLFCPQEIPVEPIQDKKNQDVEDEKVTFNRTPEDLSALLLKADAGATDGSERLSTADAPDDVGAEYSVLTDQTQEFSKEKNKEAELSVSIGPLCPQCCTPLLKCLVELDSGMSANVIAKQILFCVTCRCDTSSDDGVLDEYYEKCKGSLTILNNPFEEIPSWVHHIREKIIPCYKDFIQQTTLPGLNKIFNTAKTILSVYDGEDLVQISHLFVCARKVLIFLTLGEIFCQHVMESSKTRISELELTISDDSQATRSDMERIQPKLQQLLKDLSIAKEKLGPLEEKLTSSQEDLVTKRDSLEQALELLHRDNNNTTLKKQYEDAVKAVKVSEARLTIAQHEYQDEKTIFDPKFKKINATLIPLQTKLNELETAAAESESDHRKAIEKLKSSRTQATIKLELVNKAFSLVQENAMARVDAVFNSPLVMAKEKEGFEVLSECVKYLIQEFIPDSFQINNAFFHSDDFSELKSIQLQVSATPCSVCSLPILCVDDGNIAACRFCPENPPCELVQDDKNKDTNYEKVSLPKKPEDISAQVLESEKLLTTEVPHVDAEYSVLTDQAYEPSDGTKVVPTDPETLAKIFMNKEAGLRISRGSRCPQCYTPLLKCLITLDSDTPTYVFEKQIFFCVTCRNDTPSSDGILDEYYEKSRGSLVILNNPFEGSSWTHYLREKIIPCYKDFIQQTTLSGLNKMFNTTKTILSVYHGEDLVQISHLFVCARKVLIFLSLGEFFCQNTLKTSITRISELEQAIEDDSLATRSVMEQIQPKIHLLLKDLNIAKEKLAPLESKLTVSHADLVVKRDEMEQALQLLRQDGNNAIMKQQFEDAAKAVKVSEAHLTIVQHLYRDEKAFFDPKFKKINDSLLPLQIKLKELETAAAEAEFDHREAIEKLKSSRTQATIKLELVNKAFTLVQQNAMARADAAFNSPLVMAKEKEGFEVLSECVKYLVQEFIPDSSQVDNSFINSDDLSEIKLMRLQVSCSPCSVCSLPILCVDDGNIATCLFCPENSPRESIHNEPTNEESAIIKMQKDQFSVVQEADFGGIGKSDKLSTAIQEVDYEIMNATKAQKTVEPADFETMTKVLMTKEAGMRILNGWVLKEGLTCLKCDNQMVLCDKSGKISMCLLCDLLL